MLNTFDGKKALQSEEERHFWNSIMDRGSEVEDRHLPESDDAQNSWANQLLMIHFVNDVWLLM